MLRLPRRRFLQASGGSIAALSMGAAGLAPRPANAVSGTVRWVSPRGTIEVLDDYAFWVAREFGWFGDIQTTLEGGPMEATATIKLVEQNQSDFGFPSPGVFSLGLEQGMPITSVWHMGAFDVFSFAFRPGEKPADPQELAGKTILLGSIGWQAIVDPELAQLGVDPASVTYAEAGNLWGQALLQGQGDVALSWEGLRAQWTGQGLHFDYLLPYEFSRLPANTFVVRAADVEDESKRELYEAYLRAWAMGMEFGYLNPRATTEIVMRQFPGLASTLEPAIATESMMQLAKVFRGPWEEREGWGWHDMEQWQFFFDLLHEIGQISNEIDAEEVCTNTFVPAANDFDHEAVREAAEGFELSEAYEAVDVADIETRL